MNVPSLSFSHDKHFKNVNWVFPSSWAHRAGLWVISCSGAWRQSMNGAARVVAGQALNSFFLFPGKSNQPKKKDKDTDISGSPNYTAQAVFPLPSPPCPLQWKPQISLSHTREDSNLVSVLLCVLAIVLLKYYTNTTQLARLKCTGNGFQSIRRCVTIATTILEYCITPRKKLILSSHYFPSSPSAR